MTTYTERTIVVGLPGYLPKPPRWPTAQPNDNLDYSLDLTRLLADIGDSIASATVSIKPSGTGELQALDLVVQGPVLTVQLAGGVAGRAYVVQALVICLSGDKFQFNVALDMSKALALYPLPEAPSDEFGTSITWNYAAGFLLNDLLNSGYIALMAGF